MLAFTMKFTEIIGYRCALCDVCVSIDALQ